jgi:hypothetical protein
MPDVIGRLCARAFSADGVSVPPALRFARALQLTASLRGRQWGAELDICNDGDACMLSYIEGGTGTEIVRVPHDSVYTDISQVLRTRRIGANLLAFFGVRDSTTRSWRQVVSSCEHAFQSVPASDAVKRARLGRAMQRFVRRSLDDVGKRIDLVRYSAKHDAVGPRDLLTQGKGGAADEFGEAVARILEDQKRKRSSVADDASAMVSVRLPSETKSLALAAALEPPPKSPRTTPSAAEPSPLKQVGFADKVTNLGEQSGEATEGKFTALVLAGKPVPGSPPAKVTIRVDKQGALRWLHDHGVPKACLAYQYGHVGKSTRRWASCGSQKSPTHNEAAEGPHKIVEGWDKAALTFVLKADRHLLGA